MSKVKICGLQRLEDIQAVNDYHPDFVGFVFAPGRRQINSERATILKSHLDSRIQTVGVFVNEKISIISQLYQVGIIDWIQLHGEENDDYIRCLKEQCDATIIKAVGISDVIPPFSQTADFLLFDTMSTQRGGTGKAFDWHVLENYSGKPYFLAGGLDADNVETAIKLLNPFGVDVSSGVETAYKKDAIKIQQFISAVRGL